MPINVCLLPCTKFLFSGSAMRLRWFVVILHLSLQPPIPTLLVCMMISNAYGIGSVWFWVDQLHQGWVHACYSKADGESAVLLQIKWVHQAARARPVRSDVPTGQTGPQIGTQSWPVRPVSLIGQTGLMQIDWWRGLSTIGRGWTICARPLRILKTWINWARGLRRLML